MSVRKQMHPSSEAAGIKNWHGVRGVVHSADILRHKELRTQRGS
jgi:hypothetical protein